MIDVQEAYRRVDIQEVYQHQQKAWDAVEKGENVIVAAALPRARW